MEHEREPPFVVGLMQQDESFILQRRRPFHSAESLREISNDRIRAIRNIKRTAKDKKKYSSYKSTDGKAKSYDAT